MSLLDEILKPSNPEADRKATICLAGNPNSGKTSLFNAITGLRQHTGNYPGVTVEKKEGMSRIAGHESRIVDLPGTYNLTSFTAEERVSRAFLLGEHPDAVVCVVDSTNLERNLYLAVQILEIGMPVVLALNMSDVAARHGIRIDANLLSRNFSVPAVFTVGHRGDGVVELLEKTHEWIHSDKPVPLLVNYGTEIESEISTISDGLAKLEIGMNAPLRWISVKLLENDSEVIETIKQAGGKHLIESIEPRRKRIESILGDSIEVLMAERRYGFISGAVHPAVEYTADARHNVSDSIDSVLTNRLLGIPIFLALMYLLFMVTFKIGDVPSSWLEAFFQYAASFIGGLWPDTTMPLIKSLVLDGIIGGVGGVLVFVPIILILFLSIALLEDSGYMARAAFLTDRTMRAMGLQGKSFIPMLIGFGCTVPAVMATRTLENERDRLITIFILPLVSCGARLPVYALLISAFFSPSTQGPMMWFIYVFGIVLAVVLAKLLRVTVYKGEDTPLVMELPPYRVPTLKGLWIHAWDRAKEYIKKAGTVILAISILLWLLGNVPKPAENLTSQMTEQEQRAFELEYSVLGRMGKLVEPITAPLGFDWKINTAVLGAAAAKEVFVAQMGIITALETTEEDNSRLSDNLRGRYSTLTGICLLLFLLIATPCVATVAIVRKETGRTHYAIAQWIGLTIIAYVVALLARGIGLMLGY